MGCFGTVHYEARAEAQRAESSKGAIKVDLRAEETVFRVPFASRGARSLERQYGPVIQAQQFN